MVGENEERLMAAMRLRTAMIEDMIEPEHIATFLCLRMGSDDRLEAIAAREMAQYFIETDDEIGGMVKDAADAFDSIR